MRRVVLLALGLSLVVLVATEAALRRPVRAISPDRPGIGDGSWVLPRGVVHLESGAAVRRSDGRTAYELGQLLMRYGLGPVELRLSPGSFVFLRDGVEAEGIDDLGVGLKSRLVEGASERVRLSLLTRAELPSKSPMVGSQRASLGATLLFDWAPIERLNVSANLGYDVAPTGEGSGAIQATFTPGVSLAPEHGLGGYAGWAGTFELDGGDRQQLEAGMTWVPAPNVQLDLNGGVEPTTGDLFVGLGVAHRWP